MIHIVLGLIAGLWIAGLVRFARHRADPRRALESAFSRRNTWDWCNATNKRAVELARWNRVGPPVTRVYLE
jgi:hypothetical protein